MTPHPLLDIDKIPATEPSLRTLPVPRILRTTVHVLGRTALLLLDAGDDEDAFRGTTAQLAVIERATHPEPSERFGGVRELAEAWRAVS